MIVLTLIESSLIIQIGVLPADIATSYGADFMSGVILMSGFPYKAMFPEIGHSHGEEVWPAYVSANLNTWSQAVKVCFPSSRVLSHFS